MITDVRDVFFQSNPFIIPFSHEVCFAAEDRIIADEVCNASWITDIYGKKIFDEICGETITCSGTTLGTASAMTAYITMMCQELSWRRYDYLTACDQGFHNYIAWKIRPGFARVDLEDRIFNTIGLTNSSRIEVVGDLVLVDGAAPPVIHQWDRHEKLKEFLRSSELFRTGEPRFEPFVEPVAKTPGGKPRDFWDVFRSYHAAATAGNHESARAHLDEAASFPAEQSLPALTDRARRRFLAGEISACWTDVEQGLGALHSPLARWFKKDLAYMGALCRYAMHENGADDLLHLIPQDDPRFDEKGLEGPTMAHLEADARSDSDLLIERYLAIKQRLHHNAISWPSLVESLDSEDIILQIGAMDGVKWDPLHAVITRLNSPGVLVEPIAEMFEALQRNYYQNTRLTFANVAIAESSGSQTIYRIPIDKIGSADWAMGMSTLRKPNAESVIAPMVVPETVRGLTFADFCQEFGVTRFNLLQIDTEGYDWRVLRQIDLRRFETCIVRLEYCHLPIEDRFSVIEHLEAAGLNASCDDMDLWAGKI
jgi:FkbM family methyltransferase